MPTINLTMPRLHPGQRRILEHRQRFATVACGRRFGKTTLAVDLALRCALEGKPAGWFAPTYQLLAEAWRELKKRTQPVVRHVSEQEHRLALVTGGVIECWSLDGPDPARGRKYGRVVLDEASIVRDLLVRWNEAIRPTLTDLKGDALILGTPKGMNGFWQLYQRGVRGEPDWSSHAGPTVENPLIDPREVEHARRDMPELAFRQEYEAEFVEDGAGVFRRVAEASTRRPQERIPGHWYVAGVDWGRHHDYTVVSVIDATTKEQVHIDRFSQVSYVLQTARLKEIAKRYECAVILAEQNAMGEPLIEDLQHAGLPVRGFTSTNATKAAVVEGLALAIENGHVHLLDDETQTGELQAYTSERLPSGLIRYTAPEGMHDDTVIALALAWEAASSTGPRPDPQEYRVGIGSRAPRPLTPQERLRMIRGPGVNPFAARGE